MTRRIQLRRDTGANWTSVDPVLAAGEIGVDLTTGQIKIGNGSSKWSELDYYTGSAVDLTDYATKEYVDLAVGAIEIPDISNFITADDIPTIPADISELTDTEGLLGQGGQTLTAGTGIDITDGVISVIPEGPLPGYKGFKAHYGRLWGDDPTLSKIVIYKDTASPISTIASDTDDDLFVVSGLGSSDIVALFVIAGSNNTNPVDVAVLKSFAEAVVDTVILVNGEEGNFRSIEDMRAAFYNNIETLAAAAGPLYDGFEFYLTEFSVDGSTTVREGSGAEFTINNDGVDTYTVTAITAGGTNYLAGHKILVLGTRLGGESPANDAVITVTGISDGLIDTVSITGTAAVAGLGLFTEVTGTNYEVGSGLVVTQVGNNFFGEDFVNTSNSGSGYVVGDVITVPGDTIQGGNSPANDITITVTSVDGNGAETGFTFAGTFPTEVWPLNYIRDGGDDQYDDGNFIDTNLASEISYNNGAIVTDSETEFGSGSSYVVLYENSIFGVIATGADITSLGTSGETGSDGDGSTDTGSLYDSSTSNIGLGNFVFNGNDMSVAGGELFSQSGVLSARPQGGNAWDFFILYDEESAIKTALDNFGRDSDSTSYWQITVNGVDYNDGVEVYVEPFDEVEYFIVYRGDDIEVDYTAGDSFVLSRIDNIDLRIKAPDDLFLDALGDDVFIRAKDDIRLRTGFNFQNNEYDWQFRFTDGGSQIFYNGAEDEEYGRITTENNDGTRVLMFEGRDQVKLRVDDSSTELILDSTGLTFPDSTIQTTAWAGGRVVVAPGASTGATGDKAGDLAFDDSYIYYCTADHDGSTNIWRRVAWSNDTWGG